MGAEETLPLGPPTAPAHPPARLGRYELLQELGRGSMGIVYRARHTELNIEVALKLLRDGTPGMLKRFVNEAQSAARVRHPGIVTVHDVGEENGHHWFTMDLIRGQSLQAAMTARRFTLKERARILEQTARAVHFAHEHGVIHRDLKPGNIMLDESGRPVVTDFGLARLVDRETRITRDGASLGTPHYMSPEQVRGDLAAIDARTDVYALGVILYELLANVTPFPGASVAAVYSAILAEEPRPPHAIKPGVPQDLETICLKAMEREPARRYATAGELADDLDRFLSDLPIRARPVSTIRRAVREVRRRPGAVAIAALVVVAAVAVGALVAATRRGDELARQRDEERRRREETANVVELGRKRLEDARLDLFRKGADLRDRYAKIREAIALFEKAGTAEARYQQGCAYRMLYMELAEEEAYEAGLRAFGAALRERPDYALARLGRGLLYAEKLFDELIEGFFVGTHLKQRIPERRALEEAAIADLDAALREQAGTARDQVAASAAIAVARADFEQAERVLTDGVDRHGDEEFLVRRARLRLMARRDYEAAFSDGFAAREKQANMPGAIGVQYSATFLMGRFEESEEFMNEMLAICPDHATTLLTRAMLGCYRLQCDKAVEYTARVAKHPRLRGRARMIEALAFSLKGDQAAAQKAAAEALVLCEGQPFALVTSAAVLTKSGKFKEAEAQIERAMAINEEYPAAYSARAMLRMVQMRFDEALVDANRAIALDTYSADGLTVRGIVYLTKGEREKAQIDLRRAIKLNPFQKKMIEPVLKAAGVELDE